MRPQYANLFGSGIRRTPAKACPALSLQNFCFKALKLINTGATVWEFMY